jgi:hypothetical protein
MDANGRRYLKGPPLPQGFKPELVSNPRGGNPQGGDIYRHILFIAGNYFLGISGQIANKIQIADDRKQAKAGRLESETELLDDEAGKQVGEEMVNAFNRGKFDNLRGTLRGILCVP